MANNAKWSVIELFAGVGGVAQGFEAQGDFAPIALTDVDADARATYLENFPQFPRKSYLRRDVRSIYAPRLRDAADGREISGILGCPPCQGFSPAGKRDPEDERNLLMRDYFRLIRTLDPKFFVLENVPRILTDAAFKEQVAALETKGWRIWSGALNAALYGLPQTRQRAIVIGFRGDLGITPTRPKPTHGCGKIFDYATRDHVSLDGADGWRALGAIAELGGRGRAATEWHEELLSDYKKLQPLVTVHREIGHLPSLEAGEACSDSKIHNHIAWPHRARMVEMLQSIPEGGNAEGNGWCREYFTQAYGRLHRDGLARTITGYFHNPGSGRYIHYRDHRALTVREAARLQGFDEDFRFIGHPKVQERIIGNAFPKTFARALAAHVSSALHEAKA